MDCGRCMSLPSYGPRRHRSGSYTSRRRRPGSRRHAIPTDTIRNNQGTKSDPTFLGAADFREKPQIDAETKPHEMKDEVPKEGVMRGEHLHARIGSLSRRRSWRAKGRGGAGADCEVERHASESEEVNKFGAFFRNSKYSVCTEFINRSVTLHNVKFSKNTKNSEKYI
jgi:hypothetical protein